MVRGCLVCVICNSNNFHSYIFKIFIWEGILSDIQWERKTGAVKHDLQMHILRDTPQMKILNIVGILTFINVINTRSESLKARKVFNF